jgi:ribonuclease/clavin/mitogillin
MARDSSPGLTMSELPAGIQPAKAPVPRESAAAIVLRLTADGDWLVLMGLRSRKSRFLPGHLAFPGGRMDPGDRPEESGAYQRCISRELREETGVEIPPGDWHDAGERTTPPIFPVRFRTLFFVSRAPADTPLELAPADRENEELRWCRPADVLGEWREGSVRIPPPVLPILRSLADAGTDLDLTARNVAEANTLEQQTGRVEFVPNVWLLPMLTETLPPATHTNVWMPGGQRFVILDPGSTAEAEQARLVAVVKRRQAELGQTAAAVLLTHHHRDHVAGAPAVARSLGLPLRAHASVLEGLGDACDGLDLQPIADGDEIDLGGLTLRAHFTPGHAPGHLVFQAVERQLLFIGDLVSGLSTILINPDDGDMGDFLQSLERASALGCCMLFPGHGTPLPGRELERVIAHRREREANIAGLLSAAPCSLSEIARQAYQDVPQMPAALIERQTLAHLLLLERTGRAHREHPTSDRWTGQNGDRQ